MAYKYKVCIQKNPSMVFFLEKLVGHYCTHVHVLYFISMDANYNWVKLTWYWSVNNYPSQSLDEPKIFDVSLDVTHVTVRMQGRDVTMMWLLHFGPTKTLLGHSNQQKFATFLMWLHSIQAKHKMNSFHLKLKRCELARKFQLLI